MRKGVDFMKKYELTDETKKLYCGIILHRIRALIDFGDVKTGDLGGWIEKEKNLSQEKLCWVYNNACVFGNAEISGNVRVCDNAKVHDNACAFGNAEILGNARVYDNAKVYDNAWIQDNAWVHGSAKVYDDAKVFGNANVGNNAQVYHNACIFGKACVRGNAKIYDNAWVYGNATIYGDAIICETMAVSYSRIDTDLRTDIAASLRGQCNLLLIKNKVIAYKIVNRNLTSLYDKNFIYKIGEIAEVENPDEGNNSCASGLHFSNLTYWDNNVQKYKCKTYLIAEINVEDIITIQQGKIRCRKAKILDKIDII